MIRSGQASAITLLACLAACVPNAAENLSEMDRAALANPNLPQSFKDEIRRCPTRERREGEFTVVDRSPDRQCVDFAAPREFTGIWIDEFEGSRFVEGVRDTSALPGFDQGKRVWLEIDDESRMPKAWRREPSQQLYRVRFLGRASRDQDRPEAMGYGHLGMSHGLVLVDEMHEMTPL
ncbi:hypothetical protein ACMGDH_09585 [Sphingomonas sp. DT-207]|uniref:hypothetical protein n=1 Tax=Sphingomonas sp. DT-207 TaxID=3396167 RepID=UPI003F1B9C28